MSLLDELFDAPRPELSEGVREAILRASKRPGVNLGLFRGTTVTTVTLYKENGEEIATMDLDQLATTPSELREKLGQLKPVLNVFAYKVNDESENFPFANKVVIL